MSGPDVSELNSQDLPQRDFPAAGKTDFRVHFAAAAHADIHRHAEQDTTVEICGVLVGQVERDDDGPYVRVAHTIRCDSATSKFAEVTFTHESWAAINKEMDEKYTDLSIVGWYHTHPDFGVFLSDRDCFIHQNFFSGPGQIAHVVDPIRKTEGVFEWRDGKPVPCRHFWAGDRIAADTMTEKFALGGSSNATPTTSAVVVERNTPPGDDWVSALIRFAPFVLLFLLGFLFADWRHQRVTDWERRRIIEGVMREYGYWKVIKPGMGKRLDALSAELNELHGTADGLASQHLDALEEPAEEIEQAWESVLTQLQSIRAETAAIRSRYALDEEAAAIAEAIRDANIPKKVEEPNEEERTPETKTEESKKSAGE